MPTQTETNAITPRQLDVLMRIEAFQTSRCYSATIGELAETLNVSRATVFEHVAALREKNLIAKSNGKARCLQLTARGNRFIEKARRLESESTEPDAPTTFATDDGWMLAGRVCAGYGIEAVETPQTFSMAAIFGQGLGLFVLEVVGSSMKDAGIFDGDYIICRPAATAENGQIVVALLEGRMATLKRFYKDSKAIRLQPANDAFEPMLARDCTIQAVVTGVIRKFQRDRGF